ncbi:4a-hydroxytetrahydrobiopterin dehydratase [Rasiella rasia]|uniref:Putative pterin-4-alpha-carbinolamine dehydratase n=1 Tax=Rasiella rasia TaxID=2744027 RepID=A0A6G6GJ11_9FLAO|nr:4a-hydroxytetrahydrobiopterin dehydratase [Rasiella rasia]QIE58504.1 4a-hydroxytetrahydrobiopterin dehydratase [Rasiella rasia]
MKTYTEQEVLEKLSDFEGWEFNENALHTAFEFENFKETFTIMTRIAFEAERLGHHPDWANVYNKLHITLSTHEAGGVTDKDFEFAKVIDQLIG